VTNESYSQFVTDPFIPWAMQRLDQRWSRQRVLK
jgi:hypothetical protein